jgi:hypothetical protein
MSIDRRVAAAALASLLLVAACGGGATTAPTAAPADTPAPATDAPATEGPVATPVPTATDGGSIPGGPGTAADLEALLPSEVNGVAFEKTSFDGATFPGGIPIGGGDDEFLQFLQANGKSLEDLRVAIASTTDSSSAGSLVMAIQVQGLPGEKFLEFATEDMADQETTIGGKKAYGAGMGGFGAYVYPKDDVVFYVLVTGGDTLAEDIFQQLP